ncbi:MAG TPA: Ig-like domain-containing protein [bacterium]|nr:Ig-like domain-containing protein [bacterium]
MKKWLVLAAAAAALIVAACTTIDTTPPTVSIVVPVSGDTLAKGSIAIKALATDNKAVAKVEFYLDGSILGTDNVGGAGDTFRYTWADTAAQTAGSHTLAAKAYDNASTPNTTTSATVTIYIGGGSSTGETDHTEDITGGDSTWYPSGNPHVVMNTIHINQNGRLIVKPGCIVKFATDAGFAVGNQSAGELDAVGTAESTITFTSNNTTPNSGDWTGFDFYDQTRASTHLSYCDINYGCYPNWAAVILEGDQTIGIDHTTIHHSSKYGIELNSAGAYITGFTGNTITACDSNPIFSYPGKLSMLQGGNTLTGNGKNAIFVYGGDVAETGTWLNQGVPYFLSDNVYVSSSSGAYLTIAKGTTVQCGTGVHITVGNNLPGGLIADSVTFTSSATSPQKGDWYGIWFYPECTDAQCQLTRCNIGYGGGDIEGDIWLRDAKPNITGCSIHDSKGWGVDCEGPEFPDPDSLLAHNTFANNDSGSVLHP